MRTNNGVVESVILYYVIAFMALLFVPNPISNSIGVGNRQNKLVHTEKIELIKEHGEIVGTKTTVDDKDLQQHVSFLEWLSSLPIVVIILMGLGVIFPPVALILGTLWKSLERKTKQIVVGVDNFFKKNADQEVNNALAVELDGAQDESTKKLVNKIQGKT